MAAIELRGLSKAYADQVVVRDIDLDVAKGEFLVLVGPSGCGKSTTLRLIAGLEDCDGGEIFIDGARVNDVEPKDRDVAMVFQDYALYPHLTVYQNLSFSLRYRKVPAVEMHDRVISVADTLGIADYLQRKPRQLSGGQRQRVAIGRCLVRQPKVFLFDEPLSNLDANLRVSMRSEIRQLHRSTNATIVYVTHDQTEAMTLADRIVVMKDGNIMQQGNPRDVHRSPESVFVAGFIGSPAMNFLPAELQELDGDLVARVDENTAIRLSDPDTQRLQRHVGRQVKLGIRHSDLSWCSKDLADLVAVVDDVEMLGDETLVYFSLAGSTLVCRNDADRSIAFGEHVTLQANTSRIHIFDAANGIRL